MNSTNATRRWRQLQLAILRRHPETTWSAWKRLMLRMGFSYRGILRMHREAWGTAK